MTVTVTVSVSAGDLTAQTSVTVDVEGPEPSFRWFGQPAAAIEGSRDG